MLATTVSFLALLLPAAPAADDHGKHAGHMAECAKVCAECMRRCEMTTHHCETLVIAGNKDHAKAMRLTRDCAEFCQTSARLCARQSDLCALACQACADACQACAAECAKFPDSKEMRECAEECKRCEASCREMVQMMGHKH